MANPEHLAKLKKGVEAWNRWRKKNPSLVPDLSGADLQLADLHQAGLYKADLTRANLTDANLSGASLGEANLRRANLLRAKLSEADLPKADLSEANLGAADLRKVNLRRASLMWADLRKVNLNRAKLCYANLIGADLRSSGLDEANLSRATFGDTSFGGTYLTGAIGLDSCEHVFPSYLDYFTLQRSWPLPLAFLRGCGLPDQYIEYLPSLLNQAIQFYSCFVSHSTKDKQFAERIYSDLQNKNVRCWYAPEDLRIGDKFQDVIEDSIRLHDKLLLILSDASVNSAWVEREVQAAREREDRSGKLVLFPVRLDDAVMNASKAWAADLRRTRHIGDFTNWKDHDSYQQAFERLLRDLKAQPAADSVSAD